MLKLFIVAPALLLSAAVACAAAAHDAPPVVTSIYWSDGDSGWINGYKTGFPFRIADMDAPPLNDTCEFGRAKAYESKAFAVKMSEDPSQIEIAKIRRHGPYSRHIVDMTVRGKDFRSMSIKAGHAGSWKFRRDKAIEKRPKWCR